MVLVAVAHSWAVPFLPSKTLEALHKAFDLIFVNEGEGEGEGVAGLGDGTGLGEGDGLGDGTGLGDGDGLGEGEGDGPESSPTTL